MLIAIRDEAGTLRALAKILRDLTGRKLAEDELSRRAVLLDQAHEAIVAWTWGGPITFWNRGAEELYGFAREEAVGRVVHQLLQTGPAEAVDRFLAALARDGRWEGELEHVRRDGQRVVVETRQALVREAGQAYVLEANRDVTERRALESLQHEFLASVSHDLKNPLATIKGQAQLLRRRLDRGVALDVDQLRSGLEAIAAAASRASSQVDELLDVALVRAGRPLDLHPEPVDLVALARRLVAEYQQTTDRHTLRVEATAPALVGEWDPRRLERVVANLLANAIKYSPAGGDVTVRVASEDGPDGPRALLAIVDQGVGIPAADLPHVFERFRRGANVGGIAGTGVGLAAACRIVEQHGGTIGVESQEAAGSRFTIRLPLVEAHG